MSYPHPKEADYERAAREAGWRWSEAHAGYINPEYRDDDTSDYVVVDTAVEACTLGDVEVAETRDDRSGSYGA